MDNLLNAQFRFESVNELLTFASTKGFQSSDLINVVVNDYFGGSVKFVASEDIPMNTTIVILPRDLEISYSTLKNDIYDPGMELDMAIRRYEINFEWTDNHSLQMDDFSKNMRLIVCLLATLHALRNKTINIVDSDIDISHEIRRNNILLYFDMYWNALPKASIQCCSVLFDWKDEELNLLKKSSFYSNIPDSKRYGLGMYDEVIQPYLSARPEIFGENCVTFDEIKNLCSIINCRTFQNMTLLPLIDLVNGKPCNEHNCAITTGMIPNNNQSNNDEEYIRVHALISTKLIIKGSELLLEYPSCSNGEYLINYHHIPADRNVVMYNKDTCIYLSLITFTDAELLSAQEENESESSNKRENILKLSNLSTNMSISISLLNENEEIIIELAQYISILLSSSNYLHCLGLFIELITSCMTAIDQSTYRLVLPNAVYLNDNKYEEVNENMKSAIFLLMSEAIIVESLMIRYRDILLKQAIDNISNEDKELGDVMISQYLVSDMISDIFDLIESN